MEQNQYQQPSYENRDGSILNNNELDAASGQYLKESAKWARFLGIVGMIMAALTIISSFFISRVIVNYAIPGFAFPVGSIILMYIIAGLIMFYPAYCLYKFGTLMRSSAGTSQNLSQSLSFLKRFFKFYGIIVVVVLSLYALLFIFGGLGALLGRR